MLGVLTRRPAGRARCSRSVDDQGPGARDRGRARASRSPPSPTPTTSASSPTATPGASWPAGSAAARARWSTRPPARRSGEHDGTYGFTVGQRKGLGVARRGPAAALRPRHRAGDADGDDRDRTTWPGSARCAPGPRRGPAPRAGAARSPRRGAAAGARRARRLRGAAPGTTAGCGSRSPRSSAASPRGSPPCSTSRTPSAGDRVLGQAAVQYGS